jgi:hypothetical protein
VGHTILEHPLKWQIHSTLREGPSDIILVEHQEP